MTTSRRLELKDVQFQSKQKKMPHASLWLNKYLTRQKDKSEKDDSPYAQLVEECSRIEEPAGYQAFFVRWQQTLEKIGAKFGTFGINGRLAVGLGNESIIETGITLHHTYGVPIIPGSGLKGTASSYACQFLDDTIWHKNSDAHVTLFGSTKEAGFVTFFDALPIPHALSGTKWRLEPDVMTVHHPDYYKGLNKAPADWDNTNPINFLSVTGDFLVALYAPDAKGWDDIAYGILKQAMQEIGVGAKTSSGYGRLIIKPPQGYKRGHVLEFGLGSNQSYGYIMPEEGGDKVFVHKNDLRASVDTLHKDDIVNFRLINTAQGEQADDVHLA